MRYFLDTEFVEDGRTIDLLSIGIVAEDGRELYLQTERAEFYHAYPQYCPNDWVRKNVVPHLNATRTSHSQIQKQILEFVYGTDEQATIESYLDQ